MSLKSRMLVLFLALGVFAAHEDITRQSSAFSFVQVGVIHQVSYSANGMSFSYKKLVAGREGMMFSWTIPQNRTGAGRLSLYTVSGKLVKSWNFTAKDKPSVTWNMPQGHMAQGVYLAAFSFGLFKKTLRVIY